MNSRRRNAFTLVEMIIASSVTSMILLGMASAMLIAARAAPGRNGLDDQTMRAGQASDQMSADIAAATGFTILSAGSIELQVPDRTGDGLADTVRYSWSGVSGTPLYRTFRGGSAVAVANDVRQFNLSYVKSATKQPTAYTESGETLLFCTDNNAYSYPTYSVTSKGGAGDTFLPAYPSSAAYVRITRADFLVKSNSTASTAEVRATLRSGTAVSNISSAISDYAKIIAPTLTSSWQEAIFAQNAKIPAGNAVALTLMNMGSVGGDFSSAIRNGTSIVNAAFMYTTDSISWSMDSGRTLPIYVYGVYGTKNADAYSYRLTHVSCTMKCGNSPLAQIQTDFRAFNTPQVAGP